MVGPDKPVEGRESRDMDGMVAAGRAGRDGEYEVGGLSSVRV